MVVLMRALVFNTGRVVSAIYIEWQLFKRIDTVLAILVSTRVGMAAYSCANRYLRRRTPMV